MTINKKILVTGATSGIGLALCEYLIKNSYSVIAIGRDESKIAHLKEQFHSVSFSFESLDLNNFENYNSFFDKHLNNLKFDGFVHCAGMEETLPLNLNTPERMQAIFNINVFAGVELLRYFSKKKYSNDKASIIFISSVMSVLGQPGKIGYCATKSAILGVVKSAALELSKRRFRINAVSPGVVNTPMTQNLFKLLDDANVNKIKQMHPLGIGDVEDVIPIITFLLSDDSKWITGQNMIVDGGYSIQ